MLPKIEGRVLVTDQVFEALRASIVNGELPAGERLRIRDLADRLGTSVMPVREAIQRLEEAGLAERFPHRGAVVKGLTQDELVQVYDVRRTLEVEAARRGAVAVTAADVRTMAGHLDELRAAVDAGDAAAVLDHDEAVLRTLYTAGGNPVLTSLIDGLWERCRPYKLVGATTTLGTRDEPRLWRFPKRLLTAVRRHDADAAAEVTEASLTDATERIRAEL